RRAGKPRPLAERPVDGLMPTRLLRRDADIVSCWYQCAPFGYPVPGRERDAALSSLLPSLEEDDIYSRGRFGAWTYEVSNQDHSFMQGVEVVDRLLGRGEEHTLWRPHPANSGAFARKAPP